MEGPPIVDWWIVIYTDDAELYEGWFKDQIGDTVIFQVEPSKIRLGVPWRHIEKLEAHRERPISEENI
jgi:hypothetical protein